MVKTTVLHTISGGTVVSRVFLRGKGENIKTKKYIKKIKNFFCMQGSIYGTAFCFLCCKGGNFVTFSPFQSENENDYLLSFMLGASQVKFGASQKNSIAAFS